MATIVRCDSCKGTSDDPKIGKVIRKWDLHDPNNSRSIVLSVDCYRDLCQACVKKYMAEPSLTDGEDRDQ